MKDFFKFMLASMLGFILIGMIVIFISMGLMMGLRSYVEQQEVSIQENTVIRIDFKDPIPERTPKSGLFSSLTSGSLKNIMGLNDIIFNIKRAKEDDNIRGVILNMNIVPSGISTLEEIRAALLDFKQGGKFIYCYGEYMSQGAYYLGSVADEMYVHPQGFIDFKGLNGQVMFYKGLLDKLDIKMQIVRHGKFKSAVEPLIQEEMSPENRKQYTEFIESIWNSMLGQISESRGLSISELNDLADKLSSYSADMAMEGGLIDGVTDRNEYRTVLADRLDVEKLDDMNLISLSKYDRVPKVYPVTGDRIAVIYATGEIGSGYGRNEQIGADKFAETIARVRKDDQVKAVVFRVNSPGGDALASDIIWKELDLLQDEKPVIISMGNVAASGGYWISCASHKILADPTTLTGSIGVFGVIPDFGKFMNNQLGITYDAVGSNENAGFPSVVRPLTSYEREVMQSKVDRVYELFLKRVANNRDMSNEDVDMIAEGRIWSGVDALGLGLIDDLGGLSDAIDLAKEISGVEKFRILELPVLKDPLDQLIEDLSAGVHTNALKTELGPFYNDYTQIQSVLKWEGVQARMPSQLYID